LWKDAFFVPVVAYLRKSLFMKVKVRLEPFCVILDQGSVLYEDDTNQDLFARRDEVKRCLVEIASR